MFDEMLAVLLAVQLEVQILLPLMFYDEKFA